jgi:hypothetical protein
VEGQVNIRASISYGGRRRHIAVRQGLDGWYITWAIPTARGYRYSKWTEEGFRTKAEAVKRKREILDDMAAYSPYRE